jgi:hypothetical protein
MAARCFYESITNEQNNRQTSTLWVDSRNRKTDLSESQQANSAAEKH